MVFFLVHVYDQQSIPVWWRWYYWLNPFAWSLYGLAASQFGDVKDPIQSAESNSTVQEFLKNYFDFKHDFIGVVAAAVVGFTIVFALIFAVSIKVFNFQRR